MATLRFQALNEASSRKPVHFEETDRKSIIFGSNVFNEKAMKQFLTSDALKAVQSAVQYGTKIDRKLAAELLNKHKSVRAVLLAENKNLEH